MENYVASAGLHRRTRKEALFMGYTVVLTAAYSKRQYKAALSCGENWRQSGLDTKLPQKYSLSRPFKCPGTFIIVVSGLRRNLAAPFHSVSAFCPKETSPNCPSSPARTLRAFRKGKDRSF